MFFVQGPTIRHPDLFRETLVHEAYAAYRGGEVATSWRGYHVGAAAAGIIAQAPTRIMVMGGRNIKLFRDTPHKICAEAIAIGATLSFPCTQIIALAVYGEPEPPQCGPTLHPCIGCLAFLQEMRMQGILAAESPIITAWGDQREVFTLETLRTLHPA